MADAPADITDAVGFYFIAAGTFTLVHDIADASAASANLMVFLHTSIAAAPALNGAAVLVP
jgi:hypothetical protein